MDPDATPDSAKNSAIAVINGLPAVAYYGNSNGNPRGVYYARATVANPASATDWIITPLDPTAGVIGGLALVEIAGLPYIAYTKSTYAPDEGWRPVLARALTSTPAGAADWAVTLASADKGSNNIGMAVLGGRPALAFRNAIDGLAFAWAGTTAPTGPADWTRMSVDNVGSAGSNVTMRLVSGVPAIASFNSDAAYGISYHWATRPDPQDSSDWQTLRFFSGTATANTLSLLDVGGKPALVFNASPANGLVYVYQTN
jgi:hypothetical protein